MGMCGEHEEWDDRLVGMQPCGGVTPSRSVSVERGEKSM